MGIEPTLSAWKAEVLPLNYTRLAQTDGSSDSPSMTALPLYQGQAAQAKVPTPTVMEGVGFEPTKALPADLQSAPVDRLGTPPKLIKQGILIH